MKGKCYMTENVLRREGRNTFAELITHIVELQRANPGVVVFKLVDLWALFEKGLQDYTSSLVNIN
jgi:hypothetical protein